MTNSYWGINRANKSDRTYNKLVFLMGDIKSGRKTDFFLIILPFIFFFSFNHENRYFIHESLCSVRLALFFFLKVYTRVCILNVINIHAIIFYNKNESSQLNWYTYKLFRQRNENKMWLMSCVNSLMLFFLLLLLYSFFLPFRRSIVAQKDELFFSSLASSAFLSLLL